MTASAASNRLATDALRWLSGRRGINHAGPPNLTPPSSLISDRYFAERAVSQLLESGATRFRSRRTCEACRQDFAV